jgi:hypothetical protein
MSTMEISGWFRKRLHDAIARVRERVTNVFQGISGGTPIPERQVARVENNDCVTVTVNKEKEEERISNRG